MSHLITWILLVLIIIDVIIFIIALGWTLMVRQDEQRARRRVDELARRRRGLYDL